MGISWEPILANFDEYLTSLGRSTITRSFRGHQIAYMARSVGSAPMDITPDTLKTFFATNASWMPETRHSYTSAFRVFFAWAHKQGHLPTNPADELPDIQVPRAVAQPVPEHIYRDALDTVDQRTALMLRLAGELGLRRGEVSRVHVDDLRQGLGGAQLLVRGKGDKKRMLPVSEILAELISAGAAGYGYALPSGGWLFPSRQGDHLKPNTVGTICADALPGIWTLHKARHRFASKAYRGSRNIRAVQELLGHSNVATTERYTAVDDDEMRTAMMFAA